MARFRRRRIKARRGYASRRRRTIGKRRSFRRRGSSRRLVTRKTLRRALAPLRPEVKMLAFSNLNPLQLLTYAGGFNDDCIPTTSVTNDGTGTQRLTNLTVGNVPIPITEIPTMGASIDSGALLQSSAPYTRIGRSVRVKRIDIKIRLSLVATTSGYSSVNPSNIRAFLMRTGQIPQIASLWGAPNTAENGSSYPHWALPTAPEDALEPYQWLYETTDDMSFPAQILTPGTRKSLKLARFRRLKMGSVRDTNAAAGTVQQTPARGPDEITFRWIIRPKGETLFNDRDTSKANGYFANNHYWLSFATDNPNVQIKTNDLQWRLWFTDA